ncbi:MAG: biphenyl 2,3-dioxygenase [Gammaproteobacteria bacterium TMED1]|jgi:bacteriorhodopsin|nr:MAG: biphenyl 2,3-dioxygenase [Gammaproteobacteria bacterium TMED1]|tara:strand:+ start:1122 stop:1886 length:765 start_codon:yes stop_codon:yes gene_type:complete
MLNLNVFLKAALVLALSGSGTAYGADVMVLNADDFVGISFWLATAIMLASTVFFFIERGDVAVKWRTSLTVAGLVTGIAFWHYLYMRGIWVATGDSPTVYRYIDWLITVPLQIVEFYLILAAVTAVRTGLFWQLLIASVVMLLGGYGGETGVLSPAIGFVIGMAGWLYIIYLIFFGEASKVSAESGNAASQMAFYWLRLIVTVGWAIYPLGYFLGYLAGGVDNDSLNIIYNIADLVNKTAFGLAIWYAATQDSK